MDIESVIKEIADKKIEGLKSRLEESKAEKMGLSVFDKFVLWFICPVYAVYTVWDIFSLFSAGNYSGSLWASSSLVWFVLLLVIETLFIQLRSASKTNKEGWIDCLISYGETVKDFAMLTKKIEAKNVEIAKLLIEIEELKPKKPSARGRKLST